MSDDHEIIPAESVEIVDADYVEVLHPLVRSMQSQVGMTPENIERMMDLQERYESKIAKQEFEAARSRLLSDLPPVIAKNRRVSYGSTQYSYADLPQVIRSVMPALQAHGFSVSFRNESDSRTEAVTCILSHRGGHEATNTRKAAVEPKKGQSAVQSAQSTVTYLQRQTLLAILGVVTDDMPDADERPKPSPTVVDELRNLRALNKLRQEYGVDVEEAEEYLGQVKDWTAADIARIPAWLESRQKEGK
jgi:predicted transcriptional regulator